MVASRVRRSQWEIAEDLNARHIVRLPGVREYQCAQCRSVFGTVALAEDHVCPDGQAAGDEPIPAGGVDIGELLPLVGLLENLQVPSGFVFDLQYCPCVWSVALC